MLNTQDKEIIDEAITLIESYDSSCDCSIIRGCENCSIRKERQELIENLRNLINDDNDDFTEYDFTKGGY